MSQPRELWLVNLLLFSPTYFSKGYWYRRQHEASWQKDSVIVYFSIDNNPLLPAKFPFITKFMKEFEHDYFYCGWRKQSDNHPCSFVVALRVSTGQSYAGSFRTCWLRSKHPALWCYISLKSTKSRETNMCFYGMLLLAKVEKDLTLYMSAQIKCGKCHSTNWQLFRCFEKKKIKFSIIRVIFWPTQWDNKAGNR